MNLHNCDTTEQVYVSHDEHGLRIRTPWGDIRLAFARFCPWCGEELEVVA